MAQTETTQRQELDQAWVEEFLKGWEAAWNSHEPERLLGLMTEDIVYDDSAWPTTMRGHGDVRQFLESAWRAFPDLRFEVFDGPFIASGEPKAAFHWTGSGTHTGLIDPPGFAPTGKRIEFDGADFHEYRDARLPAPHRFRHDGCGPPARHTPEGWLTGGEGRRRRSEARREDQRAAASLIGQRQPARPSPPTGSSGAARRRCARARPRPRRGRRRGAGRSSLPRWVRAHDGETGG